MYGTYQVILNSDTTSMLVPGDLGRLVTRIYVFTVESPEPVGQGTLHVRLCYGK
jgi:hypothetical protein